MRAWMVVAAALVLAGCESSQTGQRQEPRSSTAEADRDQRERDARAAAEARRREKSRAAEEEATKKPKEEDWPEPEAIVIHGQPAPVKTPTTTEPSVTRPPRDPDSEPEIPLARRLQPEKPSRCEFTNAMDEWNQIHASDGGRTCVQIQRELEDFSRRVNGTSFSAEATMEDAAASGGRGPMYVSALLDGRQIHFEVKEDYNKKRLERVAKGERFPLHATISCHGMGPPTITQVRIE